MRELARGLGREVAAPVESREIVRREAEERHRAPVERRRLSLEADDRHRVEARGVRGADGRRVRDEPRVLLDRVVERDLERGAIGVVPDQRRAVGGREDREPDADADEDDRDRGRPGSAREREQRELERERAPGGGPLARAKHRLQHAGDHDRGDERDQSRKQHEHDPGALARGERLRVRSSDREGDEHRYERAGGGDVGDRDRQPADRDGPRPGAEVEDERPEHGDGEHQLDCGHRGDRPRDDRAGRCVRRFGERQRGDGSEQPAEQGRGHDDERGLGQRREPRLRAGRAERVEPSRARAGASPEPRGREEDEREQQDDRLAADEQEPPAGDPRLRARVRECDGRRRQREVRRARLERSARAADPGQEAVDVPASDIVRPERRDPSVRAERVPERRQPRETVDPAGEPQPSTGRDALEEARDRIAPQRAAARHGEARRSEAALADRDHLASPRHARLGSRPDLSATARPSPFTAPRRTICLPNRVSR